MHSKRTGILSGMTATYAVLMVCLLFLFLKQWRMGIRGVIYVMIIVETTKIIAGYLVSQKYFRVKFGISDLIVTTLLILLGAFLINFTPFDKSIVLSTFIKLSIFSVVSFVTIKWAKIESIKDLMILHKPLGHLFKRYRSTP